MEVTGHEILDKMCELFEAHREYIASADEEDQDKACEFEQAFAALVCDWKGHVFIPDHCLKIEHDYCGRCGRRAREIDPKYQRATKPKSAPA